MSETTEKQHAECCVLSCGHPAVWRIKDGPMPDDFTDTCEAHVGELLQPDKVSTIYKIEVDKEYGIIIDPVEMTTTFPNRYPQVEDFVASFIQTDEAPDCTQCRLNENDVLIAPCFDCNGRVKTGRSYFAPKCYAVKEDPVQVTINATGTEEFDRLLTVLTTIHLMTDDERIKAFIEAEAAQIPGTPLAHTFDLLRKAMQPGGEEIHTYLFGALSYLDDARQLVEENTPLFVVLDALHKYLDGLVGKRIGTPVTLQTQM